MPYKLTSDAHWALTANLMSLRDTALRDDQGNKTIGNALICADGQIYQLDTFHLLRLHMLIGISFSGKGESPLQIVREEMDAMYRAMAVSQSHASANLPPKGNLPARKQSR